MSINYNRSITTPTINPCHNDNSLSSQPPNSQLQDCLVQALALIIIEKYNTSLLNIINKKYYHINNYYYQP